MISNVTENLKQPLRGKIGISTKLQLAIIMVLKDIHLNVRQDHSLVIKFDWWSQQIKQRQEWGKHIGWGCSNKEVVAETTFLKSRINL